MIEAFHQILCHLGIGFLNEKITMMRRLGRFNRNGRRPRLIKVVFSEERAAKHLLGTAPRLSSIENCRMVYIKPDISQEVREREFLERDRQRNALAEAANGAGQGIGTNRGAEARTLNAGHVVGIARETEVMENNVGIAREAEERTEERLSTQEYITHILGDGETSSHDDTDEDDSSSEHDDEFFDSILEEDNEDLGGTNEENRETSTGIEPVNDGNDNGETSGNEQGGVGIEGV